MRHVSRTHRVALDWLCDRINHDSKIQIRYTDTKHQLDHILTKGIFKRDEWNNLIHWFNISHSSSTCCTENFSLISCTERMAKRTQEHKEERIGEIQAIGDELGRFRLFKFFICEQSDCVEKTGFSGRLGVSTNQNSNLDAAPSSQGWQRDALLDVSTGRLVAADKNQKYLNHQDKVST